jgi:hypothetical protein
MPRIAPPRPRTAVSFTHLTYLTHPTHLT